MKGEISYDLVMQEQMSFVEGVYRIDDGKWNVLIFVRKDVPSPKTHFQTWQSGVQGILVETPRDFALNKMTVQQILSDAIGVREWAEVKGPDSMTLR